MGAALAKVAQRDFPELDHGPMRLLLHMANTAVDEDTAPVYYRGREAMAQAIGRMKPYDKADYQAVKRMLGALIKIGAIERGDGGYLGRNAEWYLQFDAKTRWKYPAGDPRARQEGDADRTPQWGTPTGPHHLDPWGTASGPQGARPPYSERDAERTDWGTATVPPRSLLGGQGGNGGVVGDGRNQPRGRANPATSTPTRSGLTHCPSCRHPFAVDEDFCGYCAAHPVAEVAF